jgi:undecaprenyl-diphosphatase
LPLFESLFLGIVQGLTEFIPVSSSGHFVLISSVLNLTEPSLAFNVALHFGTLLALLVYFRSDLIELLSLRKKSSRQLLVLIILATLPAALIGYLFNQFFEETFSQPIPAAFFLIVTAFLLWLAEKHYQPQQTLTVMKWLDALIIGLFQALAIFPGISRSGATISAGLFRKLGREDATRFAFLMGIPIIFGAFVFEVIEVQFFTHNWPQTLIGLLSAFFSGYIAIGFLLKYVKERSLRPFAFYCLAVGVIFLLYGVVKIV